MRSTSDWIALAVRAGRREFAAENAFPFLVGEPSIKRPRAPTRTVPIFAPALRGLATLSPDAPAPLAEPPATGLLVLPIVKNQAVFPEMITVGRTSNNDVVLPDVTVSKFHAWFRVGDTIELVDAGSSNGTRAAGRPVRPKESVLVTLGTTIAFAGVELVLRDAEACWEILRAHARSA